MYSKSPPAENARPAPVSTATRRLAVRVQLREQHGQTRVEDVIGGVEVVGPVQRDDADRAVGLDLDLVGKVVCAHVVGNSRIRLAIRFRWIWDVPPITLWARL